MTKLNKKNLYRSWTIVVDLRHRFTVINMIDTPVPIGQTRSFHVYNAKSLTEVYYDHPESIQVEPIQVH